MIVELSLSKAGSPRLKITGSVRVFLGMDPIDLRKSFCGLLAVTMNRRKEDPPQGAIFVFSNRSRSLLRMPLLGWHRPVGVVKGSEKGTFAWPVPPSSPEQEQHVQQEK